MAVIEELSALLFKGGTGEDYMIPSTAQTSIIYATALEESSGGTVRVRLDDPILPADEEDEGDYEYLALTEDDDEVDLIDEEDEEEEEELYYWDEEDDEAVEEDSDAGGE